MDISDIASQQYLEATPNERLGQLRSAFEDETADGVLVVDGGECVGVITPRELVGSHFDDDARVDGIAKPVPEVERTADVRDVARLLVEGETRIAPVYVEGEIWGAVTQDAILEAVTDHLAVLSVKEIATKDVVTVEEGANLGEAINLLREHSISRLPVLDEAGSLAGIVSTKDIIDFVVQDRQRQSKGDRGGDSPTLIDLPVSNVMERPAETVALETSVDDAVGTMLEKGYDGLVVTPEYDERVAGVLTKTDVMRALTYTQEEGMDVQITNIDLLGTVSREGIRDRLEEVIDKHREMDVHHVHIRLQEHQEELRGRSFVRCQVRMRTDQDEIAGTGEEYGADEALRIALDKLERNVLELKGRRSDEEYQGQLLRKLNEL